MAIIVCLSANMYIYVVLICLSVKYKLLGEWTQRIGHRNAEEVNRSEQIGFYRDMIDLARLHHFLLRIIVKAPEYIVMIVRYLLYLSPFLFPVCLGWHNWRWLSSSCRFPRCIYIRNVPNITASVNILIMWKYFRHLCDHFENKARFDCNIPTRFFRKDESPTTQISPRNKFFIRICLQFDTISTSIYLSNFMAFDAKSKKVMILLMQIADARPMKIQTVTFVTSWAWNCFLRSFSKRPFLFQYFNFNTPLSTFSIFLGVCWISLSQ